MSPDARRFYEERDRRTREYGVSDVFDIPVGVAVGASAAGTGNGQLLVLALVNLLARMHRRLRLQIPRAPLVKASLVPASNLEDAAVSLALAINPFIQIELGSPGAHAIGLGTDSPSPVPWYAGYDGAVATIKDTPVEFNDAKAPALGAALAACMAAENLLRQVLGGAPRQVALSAWNCSEGADAARGVDLCGPLDVGRVLQIGAGGVGACLAYWLGEFGIVGEWRVVDRDLIALHNTNRALPFLASHAGWESGKQANKAEIAAAVFGGEPIPVWYDELSEDGFKPDLVLPLANERAVRHDVALRGEPIVLHATTSRLWEAQVHRHIPDRDDCIECRMPGPEAQAQFGCSTAPLPVANGPSTDAALPFLSATAGVLLLGALFGLQHGVLPQGKANLRAVCFNDVRRHGRRAAHVCVEGCGITLGPKIRKRIHAGRRWSHVDPAST